MGDEHDGGGQPAYGRLREPTHRVRHDGWTGEKQRGFLEALGRCGNVRDACRAVGMSNVSAYRLRRIDPTFGEAWDAALKQASTSLEAVAFARAVEGVEEAVIRGGEEVYRKRRYSDSLLRLLLQGSNPEKYGRTGNQASVRAREELEARVKEIERAAFNRAWRCLIAEYRYQIEPHIMTFWILRKLKVMHMKLCDNPWCAECHPERAGEESFHDDGHEPPADHAPIPPVADWLDETDAGAEFAIGDDPPLPDADPLSPVSLWFGEDAAAMGEEVLRARQEQRVPAIDDDPPRFVGYADMQAAHPPRPFREPAPASPAPDDA